MADFPASIGLTVDSTEAIKGINKVSNAFDNLIKDATDFDKALASAVNTLNRLNSVASKIRSPFELAQAQKANALLNKQVEAARERLRIRQAEVRVIEQAQRAQKLLTGSAPVRGLLPSALQREQTRAAEAAKSTEDKVRSDAFERAKLKSFAEGANILGEDIAAKLSQVKKQFDALPPARGSGSRSYDRATGFSPRFQSRLQGEVDRQIKETGRVNKELQELVANYNAQQTSSKRLVKTQDRLSTEIDKTAKNTKANTTRRNRFNEGLTGAGFSALFGGGLFETIGGGAGGFAGGLGVSLALSNLGRQLDNLSKNLNSLGTNLDKPAEALKALEESGFKVDDSIKKQVDSLLEVGKAYEAQQLVLQQITDTLGPQAVGQLTAYGEETKKLEERYQQVYAALVSELLPAMLGFVTMINNLAGALDSLPPWLKKLITVGDQAIRYAGPLGGADVALRSFKVAGETRAKSSSSVPNPVATGLEKDKEKLSFLKEQLDVLEKQRAALNAGKDLTEEAAYIAARQVVFAETRLAVAKAEGDIGKIKIALEKEALALDKLRLEQVEQRVNAEEKARREAERAAKAAERAAKEAAREQDRVFKGLNSAAIKAIDLSIRYAEATGGREAAIQEALSLLDQQAKYEEANIVATEKNLQLRQSLIDNLKLEVELKKMAFEKEQALLALERERTLESIRRQKADSAFQNESQLLGIQAQLENPFGGDALAQQLQAIEQQNRRYTELESIKRKINDLDEQAAVYADNDPRKKVLQDQAALQREYLSQKVTELDLLDAAEQKLLKQQQLFDKYGFIVNEVSAAFSDAITSLVTGTGTVEEAFSRMFENIGKAFIDMATKMLAQKLFLTVLEAFSSGGGGVGKSIGVPKLFAEGGYVTGPTRAIVGEGGSNEYVVPENRMGSAMARWNTGMRGDAVVDGANGSESFSGPGAAADNAPISITTGPVMQFEGNNYVSQEQFVAGIKNAAQQGEARALRKLQMSGSTRKRVGI